MDTNNPTNNINTEVALRIAATMTNQGRSKKGVAEASGIPLTTFSRKLNGGAHAAQFTVTEIALIADALNIHPAKLFPASFLEARIAA